MLPRSRETLTPAQWRVLERLARGARPEGIARELGTAVPTVRAHMSAIYRRLPLGRATDKRAAAIAWYRREMLRRDEAAGDAEE